MSPKDRKHMVANRLFKLFQVCHDLHIVVNMVSGIYISQETLANDISTALKPTLKHDRKDVLRLLRLPGDQA